MSDIDFDSVWVLKILWMVLLAAGIGVVGGLARYFRDDPTARARKLAHSLFLAAIAAVAAFYVLEPTTPLKLIAACLIAGYAAPAVLDGLETRFNLMVAEQKASQAIQVGEEAVQLANEAVAAANQAGPQGQPLTSNLIANDLTAKVNKLRGQLDAIKTRGAA